MGSRTKREETLLQETTLEQRDGLRKLAVGGAGSQREARGTFANQLREKMACLDNSREYYGGRSLWRQQTEL